MQLTITDFKKNIKTYLTKAMHEDIYLLKYGRVVVKMSAVKDDTREISKEPAAAPNQAIVAAVNQITSNAANEIVKETKVAIAVKKSIEQRLSAQKEQKPVPPAKPKIAKKPAVTSAKPQKPEVITKIATTLKKAEAPKPTDTAKPVRKPSKPFVPAKAPVKPADVASVPEEARKARKKAEAIAPVAHPEKAKPIKATTTAVVPPPKIAPKTKPPAKKKP